MRETKVFCDVCGKLFEPGNSYRGGTIRFQATGFRNSDRTRYDVCSPCLTALRNPIESAIKGRKEKKR
jgi:hypothetical protein